MVAPSLSGLRILLVEDEPLLAWDLELALAAAGAVVVGPASTLEMGCTLAREKGLAAAVLDFRLGDDEAGPLATLLHDRGIPFVIHTGHGAATNSWATAPVIRKPADPEHIVEIICALVSQEEDESRNQPILTLSGRG